MHRKRIVALGVMFTVAGSLGACTPKQVSVAQDVTPTCQMVMQYGDDDMGDYQFSHVLNQAGYESDNSCWLDLLRQGLDDERNLEQQQLAKGMHQFNLLGDAVYFNKAVFHFLTGVANGDGNYGAREMALLRAYCHQAINNATSRRDTTLKQSAGLARRLDQNLFANMYE